MTKRAAPSADLSSDPRINAHRRDRALRLRKRITASVMATGAGSMAVFGFLAAGRAAGSTPVASTTGTTSTTTATSTSSSAVSGSGSAMSATPSATTAPTATAAPTAQAVTGGS
jgi:hypothetical protein